MGDLEKQSESNFPGPGANKRWLDYRYTGEGRIASVVRSRW